MMADVANTAPVGEDNPRDAIVAKALRVQELARRVVYMARAINNLSDVVLPDDPSEPVRQAVDNIIVFSEMAEEVAEAIGTAGEEVESLARKVAQ